MTAYTGLVRTQREDAIDRKVYAQTNAPNGDLPTSPDGEIVTC